MMTLENAEKSCHDTKMADTRVKRNIFLKVSFNYKTITCK